MTWRAITEADLTTVVSGDELDAFRDVALADGQTDPVADLLTAQTLEARTYCGRYVMGTPGTVPDGIIKACCGIMAVDVQTRAAGMLLDPESERSTGKAAALKFLAAVASGAVRLEEQLTPLEQAKEDAALDAVDTPHTGCAHQTKPPRTTHANMAGF